MLCQTTFIKILIGQIALYFCSNKNPATINKTKKVVLVPAKFVLYVYMSRSIFLNQSTDAKSVFNPVIGAGDLSLLDTVNYRYLDTLDDFYATYVSERKYENITQSLTAYNILYNQLNSIKELTTDFRMTKLMKLILELFTGAYNSTFLYGDKLSLTIDKANLLIQIQDVLSNKNIKNIDTVGGIGQINVVKTFKLAPVYNYYITVYGMPQAGVGFDPVKIGYLTNILAKNNINPWR